jgi:hypothetical protein
MGKNAYAANLQASPYPTTPRAFAMEGAFTNGAHDKTFSQKLFGPQASACHHQASWTGSFTLIPANATALFLKTVTATLPRYALQAHKQLACKFMFHTCFYSPIFA